MKRYEEPGTHFIKHSFVLVFLALALFNLTCHKKVFITHPAVIGGVIYQNFSTLTLLLVQPR